MANPLRMVARPLQRRDREAARAFILALLRNGPVPFAQVRAQAQAARLPFKHVKTVARELKVELVRFGFGRGSYWSWQLPAA